MARKRNYRAEYRRRIARGISRGYSRSKARGHSIAGSRRSKVVPSKPDLNLDAAIREMNRGRSLTAAARTSQVSAERLRKYLTQLRIAKRRGKRWIAQDNRPRRIPVMTGGRTRNLVLRGYLEARVVGEHHYAVGEFVRTNDIEVLKPFEGVSVKAVNGRKYPLETDPNALHRIAAMDTPPFHEIYEITSNT
jgi:hypothetical protein